MSQLKKLIKSKLENPNQIPLSDMDLFIYHKNVSQKGYLNFGTGY